MAQSSDLTQYRWRNRIILLFAPAAESNLYQQQAALLEGVEAELEDRNLVVFHVFDDSGYEGERSLTRDEVAHLRGTFEIDKNAFVFVLIGKDGTLKRRAEAVVSVVDLFEQVDAMPMRRREMNAP